MLKKLIKSFANLPKSKNNNIVQNGDNMLGRWKIDYSKIDRKIDFANHDYCGDRICGDPNIISNIKYDCDNNRQK
jgi:hypothetical protein